MPLTEAAATLFLGATYGCKALDGVVGKARRDNDVGAGADQLDGNLVSNLDAAASDNGDAALAVGRLKPLWPPEEPQ